MVLVILQSEGNVDNSLYAVKPDRKMELTTAGKKQAYVRETWTGHTPDGRLRARNPHQILSLITTHTRSSGIWSSKVWHSESLAKGHR